MSGPAETIALSSWRSPLRIWLRYLNWVSGSSARGLDAVEHFGHCPLALSYLGKQLHNRSGIAAKYGSHSVGLAADVPVDLALYLRELAFVRA